MKVLFIDDRPKEILSLWTLSGCGDRHELLPIEVFESLDRVVQAIWDYSPEIVFVGFGLGKIGTTGADVVCKLREIDYCGQIIANSGDGISLFERANVQVDGSIKRNPQNLKMVLEKKER